MTLSSSQQAALRAKKAIANGNTSFKPRGEKNKAAFEVLKEQEAQSKVRNISASNSVFAGSPPHKKNQNYGSIVITYFRSSKCIGF